MYHTSPNKDTFNLVLICAIFQAFVTFFQNFQAWKKLLKLKSNRKIWNHLLSLGIHFNKEDLKQNRELESRKLKFEMVKSAFEFFIIILKLSVCYLVILYSWILKINHNTLQSIFIFILVNSTFDLMVWVPFRAYKTFRIENRYRPDTFKKNDFFQKELFELFRQIIFNISLIFLLVIIKNLNFVKIFVLSFALMLGSFILEIGIKFIYYQTKFSNRFPLRIENFKESLILTKIKLISKKSEIPLKEILRSESTELKLIEKCGNFDYIIPTEIIKKLSCEEIISIFIREIGHWKNQHKKKEKIFSILYLTLIFWSFVFLSKSYELLSNINQNYRIYWLESSYLLLLINPLSLLYHSLLSRIQIRNQYKADQYVIKQGMGLKLKSALLKIGKIYGNWVSSNRNLLMDQIQNMPVLLDRINRIDNQN